MNILQICLRVPFPPNDGAAIAMNSISRGLVESGHNLTVLAVNTPKHFVNVNKIPNEYLNGLQFKSVNINTEVEFIGAIKSVLTPSHSYNVSRFYNKQFDELLAQTLIKQSFDCILVESLFMAPYINTIRKHTKAKVILRSHNIEYTIWQTLAKNEKNSLKKWYLNHLANRLKQYEIKAGNLFDAIVSISLNDQKYYQSIYPDKAIHNIFCGVSDALLNAPITVNKNPSIYHLGSMDWLPNIEGIEWFLNAIWPLINKENPLIKCYLAGRKMPDFILKQNSENLIVNSFIEDSIGFQQQHGIMIVPLITGGGIRIKILEGLALGKVIITTSKGVEGIKAENGKHLLIADNASDFAQLVLKCVADHEFCKYISANARLFASENFSNKNLAQSMVGFINSLS